MNKIIYQNKNNVDIVVDLLYKKDLSMIDKIKDLTIINDNGINLKSFEIYNKIYDLSHKNLFKDEGIILSKITNINRAIYLILEPQSIIPNHFDEDDPSYRIVTGVIFSHNFSVEAQGTTVFLKNKFTIGLDASNILHGAKNLTDYRCSMLIICLDKNPFLNNELVEII